MHIILSDEDFLNNIFDVDSYLKELIKNNITTEKDYYGFIYYTKPDPTPGRAPEDSDQNYDIKSGANDVTNYEPEPETKKTTRKKKETNN